MPVSTTAAPDHATAWVSLEDAATHLGVSSKTIRRYIAAGRLPAQRVGPRLIRVRVSDLDAMGSPLAVAR